MKVRIVEPVAGNADERYALEDHSFRPGEEVELDDELAAAWIESGRAAAIEKPEPEPKTAVKKKNDELAAAWTESGRAAEKPEHHEHHERPALHEVKGKKR